MNVGVAEITLRLPASHSLKEKRRVVRSVCQRVRNRFNVAIAEVDGQDTWQTAVFGITCVSNSALHAAQMLDTVFEFIEADRPDAEIVSIESETINGF